jgi:tape measure domain-containing protein
MAGVARAVEIRLAIKDADAAVQKLREFGARGEQALKQIVTASKPADDSLLKIDNSLDRLGKTASSVRGALGIVQTALAGMVVGNLVQGLFDTAVGFERMSNALKFATGSSAEASAAMSFLRSESQRLGLDLGSAGESFTKLAAAAKGTALEGAATRDAFTAISEASTVLGLTADQTGGAILALEQMISKGKVSAEELRGQLGERLPGAFQIAARAMGVTTVELDKMLSQGEVLTDTFLPKFARELRNTFAGDAVNASKSAQAELNRFNNAIRELQLEVGKSGVMDGLVLGMQNLSGVMRDPQFIAGIQDVGNGMKALLGLMKDYGLPVLAESARGWGYVAEAIGLVRDRIQDNLSIENQLADKQRELIELTRTLRDEEDAWYSTEASQNYLRERIALLRQEIDALVARGHAEAAAAQQAAAAERERAIVFTEEQRRLAVQRQAAQQQYEAARNAPTAQTATVDREAERHAERVREVIQALKDEREELLLLTAAQKQGADAAQEAATSTCPIPSALILAVVEEVIPGCR